ncbi:MAG: efflux RND transporter periplasmic adaptor subunit [Flavobacteriales bacterium]|nr:efflux RND transporter periplasmic adaptor subunit [Flavobacteriales bacterium]
MNRLSLFLIGGVLLAACQAPQQPADLQALIAKKDSLKQVYTNIGKQISELEDLIISKDESIEKRRVLVTTATLALDTFYHYLDVHGNVESDQVANVTTEVPGEVKAVLVKTGDRVSKGQVLVKLNSDVMQSSIAEVKNALDLAETVFQKQKRLWDQKIGSEIEYLQAKNNKESLELKLKNLQTQTGKSTINAPFSGIIDEVFVKSGEMASPGFPILRLVNLNSMYLKADVSEDFIKTIQKGTPVLAEFPSLDLVKKVKIDRVGNYINANNRTFNIEVDLPNKNGALKPNLLASLRIQDYQNSEAIIIPSNLVQQDSQQRDFIYTTKKEGNELLAQKTLVQVGTSYKGTTEILSGLSEGQEIIVEGARNVTEGETIKVKG